MKATRNIFINSALFGFVVAVIYWFTSHHAGGTILLGLFGTGMSFLALNSYVLMRDAHLAGDDEHITLPEAPSEDLGSFTSQTPWPLLAASAVLVLLAGAITLSPLIAAVGTIVLLLVLFRLGLESNREKPRLPGRTNGTRKTKVGE